MQKKVNLLLIIFLAISSFANATWESRLHSSILDVYSTSCNYRIHTYYDIYDNKHLYHISCLQNMILSKLFVTHRLPFIEDLLREVYLAHLDYNIVKKEQEEFIFDNINDYLSIRASSKMNIKLESYYFAILTHVSFYKNIIEQFKIYDFILQEEKDFFDESLCNEGDSYFINTFYNLEKINNISYQYNYFFIKRTVENLKYIQIKMLCHCLFSYDYKELLYLPYHRRLKKCYDKVNLISREWLTHYFYKFTYIKRSPNALE